MNSNKLYNDYDDSDEEAIDDAIEFLTIDDIIAQPPDVRNRLLSGNVLAKGGMLVIAGAGGLEKSRILMSLAACGATGKSWMGFDVLREFSTLIMQSENERTRLYNDAIALPKEEYGDRVRISLPPRFGFQFEDPRYRKLLREQVQDANPDVVAFDPWNAVTPADDIRTFRYMYNLVRWVIGYGEDAPALVIVHHTRKPRSGVRASGRAKMHEASGSYGLTSAARSVFIIESATDNPTDDRVVMHHVKNNNGPLAPSRVWRFEKGEFVQLDDDIANIDGVSASKCKELRVLSLLERKPMSRAEIVGSLADEPGYGRSTVYKLVAELLDAGSISESADGLLGASDGLGIESGSDDSEEKGSVPESSSEEEPDEGDGEESGDEEACDDEPEDDDQGTLFDGF